MDSNEKKEPDENMLLCCEKRYIFAIMAFFGLFISFVSRVDLSVAIVAMVKRGSSAEISYKYSPTLISPM